jgi:hypothetical protein
VADVRKASPFITILTNGGPTIHNRIADLLGYGSVWFNADGIANIVSMSEAEAKGHQISHSDSTCQSNYSTPQISTGHQRDFMPTRYLQVELPWFMENEQIFTPWQILKAKEACSLYEMIGCTLYCDYLAIIRNNLLPIATVTEQDIVRAEVIFGKDLGFVQGKTTQGKPNAVITDYITDYINVTQKACNFTVTSPWLLTSCLWGELFLLSSSRNVAYKFGVFDHGAKPFKNGKLVM